MANARNTVWVERIDSQIVRIFRSLHGTEFRRAIAAGTVETCPKKDAIGAIRHAIYVRCGGRCEWCGRPIPENGPLRVRMNMHEMVHKSKGGEVSLANGVALCFTCHNDKAHGNRRLHFSTGDNQ